MPRVNVSLGYLAGFIDGDGSVLITLGRGVASPSHQPILCATSSDQSVLRLICQSFGGSVSPMPDSRNSKWKKMFRWMYAVPSNGGILVDLVNHLVLKHRQGIAVLALAHRRSMFNGVRRVKLATEEIAARHEMYREVRRLNSLRCTCPHIAIPLVEYLAGFFDAEGCIHISKHISGRMRSRLVVNVTNRCRWICEQFESRFGGSVCAAKGGCWQWQCSSRIAQRFLVAIKGELIMKRDRAVNALGIYAIPRESGGWSYRRGDARLVANKVKQRADAFNRKGVEAPHF